MLDAAKQIGERGVQLLDDRRAGPLRLRDEHVDLVAPERIADRHLVASFAGLLMRQKHRDILDEVGAYPLQVIENLREIGETGLRLLDQMPDRIANCLLIQLAGLGSAFLVPSGDRTKAFSCRAVKLCSMPARRA